MVSFFYRITPGLPVLPPSLANHNGDLVGPPVDGGHGVLTGNSTGSAGALTGNGTVGKREADSSGFPAGVHRELNLILKELRIITDKIRDEEDTAAIENDWKFAAMVRYKITI